MHQEEVNRIVVVHTLYIFMYITDIIDLKLPAINYITLPVIVPYTTLRPHYRQLTEICRVRRWQHFALHLVPAVAALTGKPHTAFLMVTMSVTLVPNDREQRICCFTFLTSSSSIQGSPFSSRSVRSVITPKVLRIVAGAAFAKSNAVRIPIVFSLADMRRPIPHTSLNRYQSQQFTLTQRIRKVDHPADFFPCFCCVVGKFCECLCRCNTNADWEIRFLQNGSLYLTAVIFQAECVLVMPVKSRKASSIE